MQQIVNKHSVTDREFNTIQKIIYEETSNSYSINFISFNWV